MTSLKSAMALSGSRLAAYSAAAAVGRGVFRIESDGRGKVGQRHGRVALQTIEVGPLAVGGADSG